MVLKHTLLNYLNAEEHAEVKRVTAALVYKEDSPDPRAVREWALLRRRLSAKYDVNEDYW